jgi:ferritin-like metal-binding protein YciE
MNKMTIMVKLLEVFYKALTDVVIPNYRKLLEGLDEFSVKLKTNEVRKINEKFIEAAKTNMSAFVILENLLDAQDASKADEFNKILEKGQSLIGELLAELENLCNENGVQLNI